MKTMILFLSAVVLCLPQVVAQEGGTREKTHSSKKHGESLEQQLAKLRVEIARLQTALDKNHKGSKSPRQHDSMSKKMGKGKMKMGMGMGMAGDKKKPAMGMMSMKKMPMKKKGMGMGMGMMSKKMPMKKSMGMGMGMGSMGMKGMRMMGKSPRQGKADRLSTLPGFPGFSHLYHIGSTGFFLDHTDHLKLTQKQQQKLAKIQEDFDLLQATSTRKEEQMEQDLWVLTSSDTPDIKSIRDNLKATAKLQVERRLAFIRAVGTAAKQLTDAQRKKLGGDESKEMEAPQSKPSKKQGM